MGTNAESLSEQEGDRKRFYGEGDDDVIHEQITDEVLGAAIEVHKALGPGFLETIYEEALCHELSLRRIPFERQVRVPVYYKDREIGMHVLDLVISGKVIVELKSISELAEIHKAIAISYLTATGLSVGLLLNFGKVKLEIKRVVREKGS
jgi:GxxExxY protein